MISFARRYFARRRLRPIVSALPWRLVKGWGSREHYTPPQVRRAVSDLHLKAVESYAFAAACKFEDLKTDSVPLSIDDYARLRTELVKLFSLADDFSMKHLRTRPSNAHSPTGDGVSAGYASSSGAPD